MTSVIKENLSYNTVCINANTHKTDTGSELGLWDFNLLNVVSMKTI